MNILCINPDLNARMRFKSVAQAVTGFESVCVAGTLGEGLERSRSSRSFDAIYISRLFDKETVREFVATNRAHASDSAAAHLLMLNEARADKTELASFALLGVDGFLLEPYSAQTLQQTALLAQKVHRKSTHVRGKVAIDLLVPRVIEELERSSTLKSGAPKITRALKDLGNAIKSLPEELHAQYFERLIEATENLAPPAVSIAEESETAPVSETPRRITVRRGW